MAIGVLVSLPSHVESFDPVVRRLDGARFVLATGRWPSTHLDSRAWTRRALALRGWVPEETPGADLDLLLCGNHLVAASARAWLRPGGRVALWRQEGRAGHLLRLGRGRDGAVELRPRDPVALVCAPGKAWTRGIAGCPVTITGDPRLDAVTEVGAGARARTRLALDRDRPIALVLIENPDASVARWADAIGALRSGYQLVGWAHDRCWLRSTHPFPRALSGPNVRCVDSDTGVSLAELLAAADLVLAERGNTAALAHAVGSKVLVLQDDPSRARARIRSLVDPAIEATSALATIEDAAHLHCAAGEVRRAPAPTVIEGPGRAVARLVAALQGARQWLLDDMPAGHSR